MIVKPKDLILSQSLEVFGQLANISESEVDIPVNSEINLTLTSPAGKLTEFKVKTTDEGDYQLATSYTPDEVGEWEIGVSFDGTSHLNHPNAAPNSK